MEWYNNLEEEMYYRLEEGETEKEDLPYLVNALWTNYRREGKHRMGFRKEDAVSEILELMEANGLEFDLTDREYARLCA